MQPIPVVPLREQVMFPGVVMVLDVAGDAWKRLADQIAGGHVRRLFVTTQLSGDADNLSISDLARIGVEAEIVRLVTVKPGTYRVIARGLERRALNRIVQLAPYLTAEVNDVEESQPTGGDFNSLVSRVRDGARRFIELSPDAPKEAAEVVEAIDTPGQLADRVAAHLGIPVAKRLEILFTLDVGERLRQVLARVDERVASLSASEPKSDPELREKVLRERMRAIKKELGEADTDEPVDELRARLDEAKLPPHAKEVADRELRRLRNMDQNAPDYSVTRTYLEWIADLPWSKKTEDKVDMPTARKMLDEDHHGLEKIKKRVLEYLAVRKLRPEKKGPILLFHGPPGVGKTSLAKSIARSLGRELVRVSLGGVRDEAAIRGHRRTYVGAIPGRIIQAMKDAGTRNPVIVLDELDKMGADFRGDPASALLEVLDPEQNWSFSDHYLEVTFDLSEVIFIATANDLAPVPAPLRDRMEIIEVVGYTPEEKRAIAEKHLVTKQLLEHGLTTEHLTFTRAALDEIVEGYTREAGVRTLERQIASVVRAYAVKIAAGEEFRAEVTAEDVHEVLGPPRFDAELAEETEQPGVVTGLAWTPAGGEILFIEASRMKGSGKLVLTGQLGDVMKESAQAALSYVRSHAPAWGLSPETFLQSDFHLHVPQGGVPKDGPSAGQALVTALVSLVTGRRVRGDVAMTGEITLRGNVLPVGGIKSKVLAAQRAGIKTVVLPERNRKDVADLPRETRETMEIIFAKRVEETLGLALERPITEEVTHAACA